MTLVIKTLFQVNWVFYIVVQVRQIGATKVFYLLGSTGVLALDPSRPLFRM